MQCQHEQYFDDMYPEFAPDPIRVVCSKRATHHIETAENAWPADPEAYMPMKGVRCVVHTWLCEVHAKQWDPMGGFYAETSAMSLLRESRVY